MLTGAAAVAWFGYSLELGLVVGVEERVCSVHVQIAAAREKENGGNWGADITNQIFEGVKIVIITDDR